MSSKYYQQCIKCISRSIKITSKKEHHGTQMTLNYRSCGHSNDQLTASVNVKVLIIPIVLN